MKPRKSKRNSGLQPLGDILNTYIRSNPKIGQDDLALLLKRWTDIVGSFIAERMRPIRIEDQRLICYVSSSSLIHEFSFLEADILRKLTQYPFGRNICGIRLTTIKAAPELGNKYIQASWKKREGNFQLPQNIRLTLTEIQAIEAVAAEIEEPETRSRTLRLLKAMELRKKVLLQAHWLFCASCQSFWEPGRLVCPYCQAVLKIP
jgi:hypothetical protein